MIDFANQLRRYLMRDDFDFYSPTGTQQRIHILATVHKCDFVRIQQLALGRVEPTEGEIQHLQKCLLEERQRKT